MNEASAKLSAAIKDNKMQNAKVVQVMFDSGNVKLTESSKLLDSIRIQKDKLQANKTVESSTIFRREIIETKLFAPKASFVA